MKWLWLPALLLLPVLLFAAPDDEPAGDPLWTAPHFLALADIDTSRLSLLPGYRNPPYPGRWPDSLRIREAVDPITGDTLLVIYEDWASRFRGVPIAEEVRR